MPDSGFRINPPKGIRPVLNPRVPVGDERLGLEDNEDQAYQPMEQVAVGRGRRRAVPQQTQPDDEELDELGQEAEGFDEDGDEQDALEQDQFAAAVPAAPVAPLQRQIRKSVTGGILANVARTAAPPVAAQRPAFSLPEISVEDTDRLFDWIRRDADAGTAFFGKPIGNSMELHDMMKSFIIAERNGVGAVRAVLYGQEHIGILTLVPILDNERIAVLHAYLSAPYRQHIATIMPWLLQLGKQLVPEHRLAVMALTPAQAALYHQLLTPQTGFVAHTMYLQT